MNKTMYYYSFDDMFSVGTYASSIVEYLSSRWVEYNPNISDITFFAKWLATYVMPYYHDCTYYISESSHAVEETYIKMWRYYNAHIVEMIDIYNWYTDNKSKLLNNTVASTTTNKASVTPQDGEDYVDDYPTTIGKTVTETANKTNLDQLNMLVKKYKNYMQGFVEQFLKEERVFYTGE